MKIAVIGCGNMASKVVEQIHKANPEVQFYTYTPSHTKAKELASKVNGEVVKDLNNFLYDAMDFWLIGCKPQQVNDLSIQLQGRLKDKKIVSMLAATSIKKLEELFESKNILRIMPNTPIGLGKGITLYTAGSELVGENFMQLLSKGSLNIKTFTEKELDELTVFSGSGPAYVFNFALSFQNKLISMGHDPKMARELINHLFVGSAELMQSSTLPLQELVDQVTSKGGVTIEAINVYRAKDLDNITSDAIDNALKRTDEIAQELNKNA